jgi:hypothetical protein
MRVFTEAQALESKRAIQDRLAELEREHARLNVELEVLGAILGAMRELPALSGLRTLSASDVNGNVVPLMSEPKPHASEETIAAPQAAQVAIRKPAREGSPVSKVQIPVKELLEANPGGLPRGEIMARIAEEVGTSPDSVRETIRRMLRKGMLWQDAHGVVSLSPMPGMAFDLGSSAEESEGEADFEMDENDV